MTTIQIPGPGWSLLVHGTIADLYVVRNDQGQRFVAKVLRELTDEGRRAIAREYRVLAARVHAGLMPALGGDMDAPQPYYFMPFLAGGSLTRLAGALDYPKLRQMTRWIAEAVAALHASHMQHGDLKPDNILLTDGGVVQVSDPLGNGSGCTVSLGTKCGGTPGYWAPEVALGGPISPAGDVYSLGATLFHLATGLAPRDDKSKDPSEHGVQVPEDLRRAILAMCRPVAAHRPSMEQVVAFLSRPVPVAAAPTATPTPAETPPWLKALGLLGVFAGAAAVANSATKTWDPGVERYRGSGGKFRGGGLFD
jgi:serine/threonine protein kinase